MRGLNVVYDRQETRGFFRQRITALAMLVCLLLAFGLLLLGLAVGEDRPRLVYGVPGVRDEGHVARIHECNGKVEDALLRTYERLHLFVGVPAQFTGMLVDVEPYGGTSSQLFFDSMSFGIDGGCRIAASSGKKSSSSGRAVSSVTRPPPSGRVTPPTLNARRISSLARAARYWE